MEASEAALVVQSAVTRPVERWKWKEPSPRTSMICKLGLANLARSLRRLWTGLCKPRSEYPLADPHYDYRIALPLSKPVVQNGLVLHRVKLGDPAETHYLRSTIGLVRQKLIQFFQ